MKIEKGNKIKVEYEGKLENGQVFDASKNHGKPLEFEVGTGSVIKGFDAAVIGMEKGEEKEVTIKPFDAYGPVRPDLVKEFPRERLPKEREPKVGMTLGMALPSGQHMSAKIIEVKDKTVKLDMNHPLAGKTLMFNLKIVEILPKEEKKE